MIDKNLHRRHLNESQRAMIAARLANLKDGQRADYTAGSQICEPVTQQQAADMLNVSKRTDLSQICEKLSQQQAGDMLNISKRTVALEAMPMFEGEAKERMRLSKGRGKKGKAKLPDLKGQARDHAGKQPVSAKLREREKGKSAKHAGKVARHPNRH